MKKNKAFFTGIFAFAILLGFLTGASNSPVTGIVISSTLGLAVAILGLITNKEFELHTKLNLIGYGFIIMSSGVLIGGGLGLYMRFGNHLSESDQSFVWEKSGFPAPKSPYEAMDWILTNEILIKKGFSRAQVQSLYAIRQNEVFRTDSLKSARFSSSEEYDKESPYYKMILGLNSESLFNPNLSGLPNDGKLDLD